VKVGAGGIHYESVIKDKKNNDVTCLKCEMKKSKSVEMNHGDVIIR